MTDSFNKEKWSSVSESYGDIPSLYSFDSILDQSLWVLFVSKQDLEIEYLSYGDIYRILMERFDLPVTEDKVKKSLARGGKRIIKKKDNSKKAIKISKVGVDYLNSFKTEDSINVSYIESGKPRTASKNLNDLINSLPKSGEIKIVDPYYGVKTLEVLENVIDLGHKKVKLLTYKLGGGERKAVITNMIQDIHSEYGGSIEIRINNSKSLHDRYLISQNKLFLIGSSIKNLGEKETFLVVVDDSFGGDIVKVVDSSFDNKWNSAKKLKSSNI